MIKTIGAKDFDASVNKASKSVVLQFSADW